MKNLGGKSTNKLTPGTKVPKGVSGGPFIPALKSRAMENSVRAIQMSGLIEPSCPTLKNKQ
jgi:hypothetical protein